MPATSGQPHRTKHKANEDVIKVTYCTTKKPEMTNEEFFAFISFKFRNGMTDVFANRSLQTQRGRAAIYGRVDDALNLLRALAPAGPKGRIRWTRWTRL